MTEGYEAPAVAGPASWEQLADAVVAILERGDPAVLRRHLAPGAVLWHNSDDREVDAHDAVGSVAGLHALVDGVHVDVLRRAEIPDGFVQRFVVRGTVRATRTALAAHNCVVATTAGGRITRMDEYVDPTFEAQLGLAAGAPA
jgi:ketosteroid isomerase-like protein